MLFTINGVAIWNNVLSQNDKMSIILILLRNKLKAEYSNGKGG